jgi:hypothetical protein
LKRNWTSKEIEFLKDNIGKISIKTISENLARTETAVLLKAKRLNISNTKQNQGDITIGELACIIGKDRRTINNWIQKGYFPAYKKVTRSKRAFYFVRSEEFWKWAFQNREKLNFSKIPPRVINPEPSWVESERKLGQKNERNYKIWTIKEVKKLEVYHQNGFTNSEIAEELDRSIYSVDKKLIRVKAASMYY